VIREEWRRGGDLDRADGPAEILRDAATGTTVKEIWYSNGVKHRPNGPAETLYSAKTGNKTEETWYAWGKKHRIGAPAHTLWFTDGQRRVETWWYNDLLHRFGGPTRTTYYRETDRFVAQWYHFGVWQNPPPEAEVNRWKGCTPRFWAPSDPILDQDAPPLDPIAPPTARTGWLHAFGRRTRAIAQGLRITRAEPGGISNRPTLAKRSPVHPMGWMEGEPGEDEGERTHPLSHLS
jgi:hypothetical protein